MKDFTLQVYRELLQALKQVGYSFYTFEDWCEGKAQGNYVILRHDVDLKADHSLATAKIEAEYGIRSSYYFRIVPQSNQPEIIKSIAELGHEIGYHYEDLSLFKGDSEKAIVHFETQLNHFRQFYPVRTICMHGSPTSNIDNRDLWKIYNYQDYGIIGEPYFDFLSSRSVVKSGEDQVLYFTDTARMWDGDKYNVRDRDRATKSKEQRAKSKEHALSIKQQTVSSKLETRNSKLETSNFQLPTSKKIHSTFDFIDWLNTKPSISPIMITTHPQRWTDNKLEWVQELFLQNIKNRVKQVLIRFR